MSETESIDPKTLDELYIVVTMDESGREELMGIKDSGITIACFARTGEGIEAFRPMLRAWMAQKKLSSYRILKFSEREVISEEFQ